MKKACRNCVHLLPEVFNGEVSSVGRCSHIGFFKSGYMRWVRGEGGEWVFERVHDGMQFRLGELELGELLGGEVCGDGVFRGEGGSGWGLYDLIDIRNSNRVCSHWGSPLSVARRVFEWYGDSWEDYGFISRDLRLWFEGGMEVSGRVLPRLSRLCVGVWEFFDVSEDVLGWYGACVGCRHYEVELDGEGYVVPFRGFCRKLEVGGMYGGVGEVRTYGFLSCGDWEAEKGVEKLDTLELPPRLLIYVETNDVGNDVGWYEGLVRSPLLNRRGVGGGVSGEVDLVGLLRGRHRGVDFVGFNRDYGLGGVRVHFAKRLKESNLLEGLEWGRFELYRVSDAIYGGE